MLNSTVSKLINEQIMNELYSAYLYLDMANYYADVGLSGFSNWFEIQAQEERDHALLFRTYLLNNDEKVKLLPIEAPDMVYDDFAGPLHKSLEHERLVTSLINNIYGEAMADKDYRSLEFLNWFIKEQGEEEKNASDLITKFELFGRDPKGLYDLDQEMAGRAYSAPSLVMD